MTQPILKHGRKDQFSSFSSLLSPLAQWDPNGHLRVEEPHMVGVGGNKSHPETSRCEQSFCSVQSLPRVLERTPPLQIRGWNRSCWEWPPDPMSQCAPLVLLRLCSLALGMFCLVQPRSAWPESELLERGSVCVVLPGVWISGASDTSRVWAPRQARMLSETEELLMCQHH